MYELHDSAVARELVHKRQESNVFVAELDAVTHGVFDARSSFPVAHDFYNDCVSGLSASGYVIEVSRQANIAICHRYFGVPLGAGFLVTAIEWQFEGDTPFVVRERKPFVVRTEILAASSRKDTLVKLSTRATVLIDDEPVFSGQASFLVTSRRIGSENASAKRCSLSLCTPLDPDEVQVLQGHNVLIGRARAIADGRFEVPVIVDATHPFFFEHYNEHVPGMLLLEAGKQAAIHVGRQVEPELVDTYGDFHSGEIRFGRFANLHDVLTVICSCGTLSKTNGAASLPIELCFWQAGKEIGQISGNIAFMAGNDMLRASALVAVTKAHDGTRAFNDDMRGAV